VQDHWVRDDPRGLDDLVAVFGEVLEALDRPEAEPTDQRQRRVA
jgi:hypothetical protein